MYILLACDDGDILNTIRIGIIIVNIVKVILPLLVIFFAIKDFTSVVTSGKNEKMSEAIKMFAMRVIAALIVFFLPTIIDNFIGLIGNDALTYHTCIENATPEGIKQAYYEREKWLIAKAKKSLDFADFADAKAYLERITDPDKVKELEKELNELNGYMSIRVEISAMQKKEEYEPLKQKINSVGDAEVREKLLAELDAKYKHLNPEHSDDAVDGGDAGDGGGDDTTPPPTSLGGTVVKQEETATLKVTISKINTYYVTQIWVSDPYQQLNKYDSPQYGQSLYRPGQLLQEAINRDSLGDKLIVGFNASGFYLRDTYDAASVNYYAPYDKTSVGTLVITNGNVVRNVYDKAYKTWYIAAVDKSGTLQIYKDEKTNDVNSKKAWSESIIGNVRNTFTFASPLVMNGAASSDTTSMPSPGSSLNRQAICQIDTHNFMLITGSSLNRQNMIDLMLKAGCKTGTNFDGGGSIALLYKSKNSNTIETMTGNGRSLTEVGYFSE